MGRLHVCASSCWREELSPGDIEHATLDQAARARSRSPRDVEPRAQLAACRATKCAQCATRMRSSYVKPLTRPRDEPTATSSCSRAIIGRCHGPPQQNKLRRIFNLLQCVHVEAPSSVSMLHWPRARRFCVDSTQRRERMMSQLSTSVVLSVVGARRAHRALTRRLWDVMLRA